MEVGREGFVNCLQPALNKVLASTPNVSEFAFVPLNIAVAHAADSPICVFAVKV